MDIATDTTIKINTKKTKKRKGHMIPQDFKDWLSANSKFCIGNHKGIEKVYLSLNENDAYIGKEIALGTIKECEDLLCGYIIRYLAEKESKLSSITFVYSIIESEFNFDFANFIFQKLNDN